MIIFEKSTVTGTLKYNKPTVNNENTEVQIKFATLKRRTKNDIPVFDDEDDIESPVVTNEKSSVYSSMSNDETVVDNTNEVKTNRAIQRSI